MIEVNLLGAIPRPRSSSPQLRDGGGDLVNISSVAGRTARPGNAVYAATKWGMDGWSESLRQELQPDIRVTLIEPGAVATELTDHITDPRPRDHEQFVRGSWRSRAAGHRRGDRIRGHPPPTDDPQRDPSPPHQPNRLTPLARARTDSSDQREAEPFTTGQGSVRCSVGLAA